jgi:putative restriction endonuclease
MKAVFVSQQNPSYDDLPGVRYHFPKRYLRAVERTIGDSIVYYESGRVPGKSKREGRMAYFGIALVTSIEPDPDRADHYYAHLNGYLPFVNPVPLRLGGQLLESSLKSEIRQVSGVAQSAVRTMPDPEFERIVEAGFGLEPIIAIPMQDYGIEGMSEPPLTIDRPRSLQVYERPFRDRIFSQQIMTAYDKRCAVTGLRLVNGGGRAEAQAAHILPVEENGPDVIQNGVSLSSTVHWMFDRGIISFDDDLKILRADGLLPEEFRPLFNQSGYLLPPAANSSRPHPKFLRWHRENRFKG